jgi:hypothetical protein
MTAPVWMRRLNSDGRVLAPLPAGRSGYGVFPSADRRRRPFATVTVKEVREAVSAGALDEEADGYRLTIEGRARLDRADARTDQPFADQHRTLAVRRVMEADGARSALADANACAPLARYLRPQGGKPALLEAVHASAASILVRDYERSALTSRLTMSWSPTSGGKTRSAPKDRAEAPGVRLDAQKRVLDALDAVGPGLDRLLTNVLLREVGMCRAERELGWPERTGAPALKLALDRLAIHYRLKKRERVL